MLLIPCPWCGERAEIEFTYGGDASVRLVDSLKAAPDKDWYEAVYLRDNPKGAHSEYWHHTHGCRQWLKVDRNTVTHQIDPKTRPAGNRAKDGLDE
jgi:heterotetrameric sarcosine oxidase delta subunit